MTPEQKLYAIINLVTLGIVVCLVGSWLTDRIFDWIERRWIEPWKARIIARGGEPDEGESE